MLKLSQVMPFITTRISVFAILIHPGLLIVLLLLINLTNLPGARILLVLLRCLMDMGSE